MVTTMVRKTWVRFERCDDNESGDTFGPFGLVHITHDATLRVDHGRELAWFDANEDKGGWTLAMEFRNHETAKQGHYYYNMIIWGD